MAEASNIPEEWRTIAWATNYEVSSLGRVQRARGGRGARKGVILKPHIDNVGYPALHIASGRRSCAKRVRVHRLVCEAFHGPAPFERAEVAHYDGSRDNNRSENLRWTTRKENADDAFRHGRAGGDQRGERHWRSRLTEDQVAQIRGAPTARGMMRQLADRYGVSPRTIGNIRSRFHGTWKSVPFPD